MTAQPRLEDFARLTALVHAQRADLAAQRARLARLERRRRPRRLLPLALVALLVALVPMSLLAANPFRDLTGGVHDPNIDLIYNAGITTGCDPGVAYCPTANVTREEMASFLARTAGLGTNPPVANARTAISAQTAQVAERLTLNGAARPPETLVGRAGIVFGDSAPRPITASVPLQGVLALTVNVPAQGYLLLDGLVRLRYDGGCPTTACYAIVGYDAPASASPGLLRGASATGGVTGLATDVPIAGLLAVPPGPQTITLTVGRYTGDWSYYSPQLRVLFVPLGLP